SCSGTQKRSAVHAPVRGSIMTTVKVSRPAFFLRARMYGIVVRPAAKAICGQGGAKSVPGAPKRSPGAIGPHGASTCQSGDGAMRFQAISTPRASATPRQRASWPALPSLMIQALAPASGRLASSGALAVVWVCPLITDTFGGQFAPVESRMGCRSRNSGNVRGKNSLHSLRACPRPNGWFSGDPGMALRLDATDRRILRELMADGALTNVALAQKVGLSAPPCLRRVRALEDAGVIQGYTALVDERALGFALTAFALVGLHIQAEPDLN